MDKELSEKLDKVIASNLTIAYALMRVGQKIEIKEKGEMKDFDYYNTGELFNQFLSYLEEGDLP